MITNADMTKLEEKFATKDDLIEFKDAILHEIRAIREDIAIWKRTRKFYLLRYRTTSSKFSSWI